VPGSLGERLNRKRLDRVEISPTGTLRGGRHLFRYATALVCALALLVPALALGQTVTPGAAPAPAGGVTAPGDAGPADLAAQPADQGSHDGPRVSEVRVVGNRRIEADAVKAVLQTKVGGAVSQARISEDVRKIYGLGFFHDVRVDVSPASDGGAIVTYSVSENPVIRQVSISGNDVIKSEEIKEKLTITVGSTVDYPLILENKARIEAQYQAKGYYTAKVKYELEPQGEGGVGVNFEVEEGKKLKLRDVDFHGNTAFSDRELRRAMQTKTWGLTSWVSQMWDNSGLYAEPIFYQDLDKIQRMYMDKGYIRVSVGEPQVNVTDDGIKIGVDISEGSQFKVGTIDVLGDETMDRDQLLKLVQLSPGEVFSRSKLTADVDRLRSFYGDRGFYDASVNPITQVDVEKLTIACNFDVKKGELYFVDGIDLHGNTRTEDEVVRRELSIAEGDMYSAAAVARSKMRVQRLGYFEEVEIAAKPTDEPHRVGMSVDLVEKPTGSFSFGAGVGSVDGFIVSGSIKQDNLFGTGRSLSGGIDLGSINRSYYVRFIEPYLFGSYTALSLTASSATSQFSDFKEKQTGGGASLSYPLDEAFTYASGGYQFSGRSVSGFQQFQAASLLEREEFQGTTTSSLASLSVRRDTRDDIRFPKSGNVSGLAMEMAGLGGFSRFLRLEGRTTQFWPLKPYLGFESTFVLNARVGYVFPWNKISDFNLPGCGSVVCDTGNSQVKFLSQIDTDLKLPLTERYFLGGIGPFQVRGFKQRSLGPRRTILSQELNAFNDRIFSPFGRFVTEPNQSQFPGLHAGDCKPGHVCNDLTDTEIKDFENLKATDVVGGNSMALVNLEFQFPISEEMGLSGVFFLDMGNAFAESDIINPVKFRFGTGAGIQWFSPFGPILVTLGFPLDRLPGEQASVFEFSLGGQQY
jgi:outer membrane protein insertion porin family